MNVCIWISRVANNVSLSYKTGNIPLSISLVPGNSYIHVVSCVRVLYTKWVISHITMPMTHLHSYF